MIKTVIDAFVVDSIVAVIFLVIGVSAWKSKDTVGFFTFVNPPKVKNIKRYNHAVAKLWFAAALMLEVLGVPLLWLEQNSPLIIFTVLGVMILAIAMMIVYVRIEVKHKL